MKILAVGDVAGSCGTEFLRANLRKFKTKYGADLVIVNAENSSDANGVTAATAKTLFDSGADILTGGNHSLRHRDAFAFMDAHPALIRPLNLTDEPIGNGYVITNTFDGRLMTVSLMGQTFMSACDSPFAAMERLLEKEKGRYDFVVVDLHAEATSEKLAFANVFSDRVSAIFGTHTHVQTADEQIINGCAYITDIGMCGSADGILGAKSDIIVKRFVTRLPEKFAMATTNPRMDGILIELGKDRRAKSITRITEQ